MKVSRVDRLKPSATLKISETAKKLKKKGKDVIDASVGEPDFNTPSHIIDAAINAMKSGKTKYVQTRGIPELVDAIVEKYRKEGVEISQKNVIVTPGAKYAIFEAVMSTIEKGDEVILLDPSWVSFEACVLIAEGKVKWIPHAEGFHDAPLEEHITKNTRMIIINSPNNPLGVVYPKSFLNKVRDLVLDHNLILLSDEIYEKIVFEDKYQTMLKYEELHNNLIVVNGFSKTYAMTGWRLGFAVGPEDVISRMLKIQSHSVSHPTTFVQYAGVAALNGDQDCVRKMVSEFKKRRDILSEGLKNLELEFAPLEGAFYAFVNVKEDGLKFSERFLEEKLVATVPGIAFGRSYKNWIRISYAISTDKVKELLDRLEKFIGK